MEKFKKIKIIGSGTFGSAWLVESLASGRKYALKELAVSVSNGQDQRAAMNEVRILAQLKHKNIVRYKEAFVDGGKIHIVMEYAEKGDLYTRIKSSNGKYFTEQQVMEWFTQLCLALKYIHSQNILHRDLKTQNIFLTKNDVIKLGDFGIARILDSSVDHAHTAIGTPYYLSPEICQRKPYNHKSDMWSLGCVLYEMTTLKHAFDSDNFSGLVLKIVQGKYPPIPKFYGPLLEDLISVLLRTNPGARPSAKQILYVPAMKDYVEKFVSFSRDRTDSVSSDVSSVSIKAASSRKPIQNTKTPCSSANTNSATLQAKETDTEQAVNDYLANKGINLIGQNSQSSSKAYERFKDTSPKEISSVGFVGEPKRHQIKTKSRKSSLTYSESNDESVFKREKEIIKKKEGNCSARTKSYPGEEKTAASHSRISNVPGCRKQRNYDKVARDRSLSVFDEKIAPSVTVRKRVMSEHLQKCTTKKVWERKAPFSVIQNVARRAGENILTKKLPQELSTKQQDEEKENNLHYLHKKTTTDKDIPPDNSTHCVNVHTFHLHKDGKRLVTRNSVTHNNNPKQSHPRDHQSHNQMHVTQGVTCNKKPHEIRKRTYTISSSRRESQFGEIPDVNNKKISGTCRSKSESGFTPSYSYCSAEQPTKTAKKVKVLNLCSSTNHEKTDKPSVKFIFCGQTLDLDNVNSTDSEFTRMEAMRLFLETHLGYEVFSNAYQCVKGVTRLDKEKDVCKAVVGIIGHENLKYFPLLIQLVSCESIHYS